MRRGLLLGVVLAVLVPAAGAALAWVYGRERAPILVGLLHSQTGAWATTEQPMLEAELLAIEEINAAGGLLGRPVRAVVADGRSEGPTFARQAQRLIHGDKVSVLIGCWTSEARIAVRPVVEEAQHLLVYPPAYEGLEQSPHIVYVGGPANQQTIPAVSWCFNVRRARKFFLLGSDSTWARTMGTLVKDQLHALRGELVGELYLEASGGEGSAGAPNGDGESEGSDVNAAVRRIQRAAPDVVLSMAERTDNPALYSRLRRAGITPDRVPVISLTLGEDEVRRLPAADVAGQYAAWKYFQSVDRPENREFIRRFRAKYGADRLVGDNIQIAYHGVRIWAQTVVEAQTDDVATVNREIVRQSLAAPEGILAIDAETRHGWRRSFLGRVRSDGEFEVVWSLPKSIRPVPFPLARSRDEWDALLESHRQR
jgi:urea transport system substrate-binding protein